MTQVKTLAARSKREKERRCSGEKWSITNTRKGEGGEKKEEETRKMGEEKVVAESNVYWTLLNIMLRGVSPFGRVFR